MIKVLNINSPALAKNALGDPAQRKLHVVVPDDAPDEPLPCLWYLAGYAGVGRSMLGHDPWQEGLEERLIRLREEKKIGPMLVVLPDAFTRWGGAQDLDTPAMGNYAQYLQEDLRKAVEYKFKVSKHGIAGKSSGGYGALVHGMQRPDLYSAVACHSGDMGFELSLFGDLPQLMNAIRDHGSLEALDEAHKNAVKKKTGRWFGPMSMLALCASYSPDPEGPLGVGLPFDLERGTLKSDVLLRWLEKDPVRLVDDPKAQEALRQMKLLFVDCGSRDEHALHWGALTFHKKLEHAGIEHVYETFDDGHRGTGYRLDRSLPLLYEALTA